MGEMLPLMLDRIERFSVNWRAIRERGIRVVWDGGVWVTTSGMFYLAPFAGLVRVVKMERILYSVDYPFESNEQGKEFIKEVEKSGAHSCPIALHIHIGAKLALAALPPAFQSG
jgi:predicted TIM-barrel fold metal-dependent hydrolase